MASISSAQSPTAAGYGETGAAGMTAAATPVASPVTAEPGSRATLPFTGAQTPLLALTALLLLCVGLTLRRATRATSVKRG